jgi:hypothetical protein
MKDRSFCIEDSGSKFGTLVLARRALVLSEGSVLTLQINRTLLKITVTRPWKGCKGFLKRLCCGGRTARVMDSAMLYKTEEDVEEIPEAGVLTEQMMSDYHEEGTVEIHGDVMLAVRLSLEHLQIRGELRPVDEEGVGRLQELSGDREDMQEMISFSAVRRSFEAQQEQGEVRRSLDGLFMPSVSEVQRGLDDVQERLQISLEEPSEDEVSRAHSLGDVLGHDQTHEAALGSSLATSERLTKEQVPALSLSFDRAQTPRLALFLAKNQASEPALGLSSIREHIPYSALSAREQSPEESMNKSSEFNDSLDMLQGPLEESLYMSPEDEGLIKSTTPLEVVDL